MIHVIASTIPTMPKGKQIATIAIMSMITASAFSFSVDVESWLLETPKIEFGAP